MKQANAPTAQTETVIPVVPASDTLGIVVITRFGAVGKKFAAGVRCTACIAGALRSMAEYALNIDGKENGISNRSSATPQRAKNVFLGSLLIASVRVTIIAKIKMAPAKLI